MEIHEYKRFFKDWKLGNLIGSGGVGQVYELTAKGKKSALKYIHLKFPETIGASKKEKRNYFLKSSKEIIDTLSLVKRSNLKNVVKYYDIEKFIYDDSADIFILMELLEPLQTRIKNKGLTEADIQKIGIDICEALISFHEHGLLHRDVKISNILYDGKNYKLGDFDTVTRIENVNHNVIIGSPQTMSPETINKREYTFLSDIYSLGMTLYSLLNSMKYQSTEERMKGKPLVSPKVVSPRFFKMIKKACNYNPQARYQSAKDFLADLKKLTVSTQEIIPPSLIIEKSQDNVLPAYIFNTYAGRGAERTVFQFQMEKSNTQFDNTEGLTPLTSESNLSNLQARQNQQVNTPKTEEKSFSNISVNTNERSMKKEEKINSHQNLLTWFFFTLVVSLVPMLIYFLCTSFLKEAKTADTVFTHEFIFFDIVVLTSMLKTVVFGNLKRKYRKRAIALGIVGLIFLIAAFGMFSLIIVSETVEKVVLEGNLDLVSKIMCVASIVMGAVIEYTEDISKWTI